VAAGGAGLEYQIVPYKRDPKTRLAPPELKAFTVSASRRYIRDGAMVVAESGAIVEYLVGKYGNGRLAPPRDLSSPDYVAYLQWLHFAKARPCCRCS
jgi:glutathione S-transferase